MRFTGHTTQVAASASACAILGLLAYRAGKSIDARPATISQIWQLDAWQQGWTVGYDSDKRCHSHRQAYGLAFLTIGKDIPVYKK